MGGGGAEFDAWGAVAARLSTFVLMPPPLLLPPDELGAADGGAEGEGDEGDGEEGPLLLGPPGDGEFPLLGELPLLSPELEGGLLGPGSSKSGSDDRGDGAGLLSGVLGEGSEELGPLSEPGRLPRSAPGDGPSLPASAWTVPPMSGEDRGAEFEFDELELESEEFESDELELELEELEELESEELELDEDESEPEEFESDPEFDEDESEPDEFEFDEFEEPPSPDPGAWDEFPLAKFSAASRVLPPTLLPRLSRTLSPKVCGVCLMASQAPSLPAFAVAPRS